MRKLIIKTYAKINLYLDILNKREDGYHNIETVYQNISLSDELIFEKKKGKLEFVVEGDYKIPSNEQNLVIKSVKALENDCCKEIKDIKIILKKKIPTGAGLGGGSSNAAGTLNALNILLDLGYSSIELENIATKIGMDVPFFIEGGTAIGTGRGEILHKISNMIDANVIVLYPNFAISTPFAYQCFSKYFIENKKTILLQEIVETLKNGNYNKFINLIFNRFEIVLKKDFRQIEDFKKLLIENGCDVSFMTGSGSSIIGLLRDKNKSDNICKNLKSIAEVKLVESANFVNKGWEITD